MEINVILVSLIVSVAASILGVFIILRRMALVSDVLSHVALPGMALSLFFGINVFLGAFAALFAAILGIFFLEERSKTNLETSVGILFTISLALGMVFFPEGGELLEGLFGNIQNVTKFDVFFTVAVGGIIILATLFFFKSFAHTAFSKELTQSEGFSVRKINFIFLVLLACVIALGIKIVGTLLMGSLTILPVSVAKNLTNSLRSMVVCSIAVSIVMTISGLVISSFFNIPLSATVILTGGALFVLSLLKS